MKPRAKNNNTVTEAGAPANQTAANKMAKYMYTMNWSARTSFTQLP